MLKILSKNSSAIELNNSEPNKIVETVKKHIFNDNCENLTFDISHLNLLDACKISVLCSTEHYLKYPKGKINWLVSSKNVEDFTSSMNLGNAKYLLK